MAYEEKRILVSTPNDGDPLWDKIMSETMSASPRHFKELYQTEPWKSKPFFEGAITAGKISDGSVTAARITPDELYGTFKTTAYTGGRGGGKTITAEHLKKLAEQMRAVQEETERKSTTTMTREGFTVRDSSGVERVKIGEMPEISWSHEPERKRGAAAIAESLRRKKGVIAEEGIKATPWSDPYGGPEPAPLLPEPVIDRGEEWGSW